MRKIIAGFASSVDGYIEGPNGEFDWILIDKEIDFAAYFKRFDTFLLGRKTYEMILEMGSTAFAGIKSYVFSNTLTDVDKKYTLIKGNIKEQVELIKNQPGKDIAVYGGAGLLSSLLDLHLIDEIEISIIPVLLGSGKPMVSVLKGRVTLSLTATKTYSNGTVQITYKVK